MGEIVRDDDSRGTRLKRVDLRDWAQSAILGLGRDASGRHILALCGYDGVIVKPTQLWLPNTPTLVLGEVPGLSTIALEYRTSHRLTKLSSWGDKNLQPEISPEEKFKAAVSGLLSWGIVNDQDVQRIDSKPQIPQAEQKEVVREPLKPGDHLKNLDWLLDITTGGGILITPVSRMVLLDSMEATILAVLWRANGDINLHEMAAAPEWQGFPISLSIVRPKIKLLRDRLPPYAIEGAVTNRLKFVADPDQKLG